MIDERICVNQRERRGGHKNPAAARVTQNIRLSYLGASQSRRTSHASVPIDGPLANPFPTLWQFGYYANALSTASPPWPH